MVSQYHSFQPNEVLTAAALNAVQNQTVINCDSGTRPGSFGPAPVLGMVIAETDSGRLMVFDGSSWIRVATFTAAGRTRCIVSRTADQAVVSSAGPPGVALTWNAEISDLDNFITVTGGTFLVPSSLGGLYSIQVRIQCQPIAMGPSRLDIVTGTGTYPYAWDGNATQAAANNVLVQLAGADTIQFNLIHQAGALGTNVQSGRVDIYRLSA